MVFKKKSESKVSVKPKRKASPKKFKNADGTITWVRPTGTEITTSSRQCNIDLAAEQGWERKE